MALHFNCPFCNHSQSYAQSPAGGFSVCPSCSETLPESFGTGALSRAEEELRERGIGGGQEPPPEIIVDEDTDL